jgi:PmbA protein
MSPSMSVTQLQSLAEKTLARAQAHGADHAQVGVSCVEVNEVNVEAGQITLYRSYVNQSVALKVLRDGRVATQTGNQFSEDSLEKLAKDTAESALGSPQDDANAIAPQAARIREKDGVEAINEDLMMEKIQTLVTQCREQFPITILEGASLTFRKSARVLVNSNGVDFQAESGKYDAQAMFTSKKDGKASSFNYTGFELGDRFEDLLSYGGLQELLRQSAEQIHTQKVSQKFEGDLILTPHVLGSFLGMVFSYLSGARMLKKESFLYGKLGQRVASPHLSVRALPKSGPFVSRSHWTGDGLASQDEVIFDHGVLGSYLLDQYTAKKLSLNPSLSQGSHLRCLPGQEYSLNEMIAGTKSGVLLGRFSGGSPSENGDFSGIAKNSYLIRDGQIQAPLSEAMISGNLSSLIQSIDAISKESIHFGSEEMPWVRSQGITVS